MQCLQVGVHVELVLLVGSALLVLDGAVEGAQTVYLHLLRIEQHLDQARTELLQYSKHHVLGVNRAVLTDVLCQSARVHSLKTLHVTKPLAERLRLVCLVLLYFIQNFCHKL